MNENNAAKAVQEAERIAAADEYFQARTWIMDTNDNRRIFEAGFDRAYALLSKLRAPVSSIREGFELTYAADADDPACASDLSHFTNGWRACVMSQVGKPAVVKLEVDAAAAIARINDEVARLRAPVADERAAFEAWALTEFTHPFMVPDPLIEDPDGSGDYVNRDVQMAWAGFQQACAALASAPVAGEAQPPTDDELRGLAVKYDVSQDAMRRWHFRDVVPLLREALALYAAPQARPSDDKLWDQTLTERDEYHDMADKLANAIADHLLIEIGEHSSSNCPWMRALEAIENAAPQASAEDALTAPADVAQLVAFIFDRFGQPGDAGALPDNVAAAVRRLERGSKAQADKDGGQQRAGEVDERAAFEAWAYRAGMGPKFRESMFAAWEARAALSAPQAEQGERDA
ncbi:hypothetical protein [Achromobacter xylosoxidans]